MKGKIDSIDLSNMNLQKPFVLFDGTVCKMKRKTSQVSMVAYIHKAPLLNAREHAFYFGSCKISGSEIG